MSQREDMDDVRADIARTTQLAKLLFEQQFIRCGGRMPADPEWDDLEEVERDEWFERAVDARPLIDAVEASRRDWAAETGYLRRELEFELRGINVEMEDIFIHVGDRVEFIRPDGRIARGEVVDVDPLRVMADDTGNVTTRPTDLRKSPPCSCLTAEQAAVVTAGGFSLPRCAVHPEAASEDAALLAVAEARTAADTGERHSLDEVAREFGVDLTEPSGHPEADR